MIATDTVLLGDVVTTADGYVEAIARTARVGVQQYSGEQMGKPELAVVNVFRDETEVFSKRSLESFSKIPLTVDHPPEAVNAKNWEKYAKGTTGDEVLRDGEFLKIGLKVKSQSAIDALAGGKRELSVGYSTDIVWGDGVAPDGTPYQARQTNIVANHIAIVQAGRAGPKCRVGDSWPDLGGNTETLDRNKGPDMQKMTVDGITIEVSDTAAQVVSKAITDAANSVAAANKARDEANAALAAERAAHTKALDEKNGELAILKGQVLTGDALDAAVAARSEMIATAKRIVGDSFVATGKDDAAIRREVVTHVIGADAAKALNDGEITGAYKFAVVAPATTDPLARAIGDMRGAPALGQPGDIEAAYREMQIRDSQAWAPAAHKGA